MGGPSSESVRELRAAPDTGPPLTHQGWMAGGGPRDGHQEGRAQLPPMDSGAA